VTIGTAGILGEMARGWELAKAAVAHLRAAPLSSALAAANVAAFGVALSLGAGHDETVLLRIGALERSRVWAGEPWRLLTAAFLHVGWLHLACNVVFGWPACRLVERALGSAPFLGLYLASAIGGSALSLLGQDGVAAGASGALFGIAGAILALHLRALGGWRPFLASSATRALGLGIVATTVVVPLLVPLDHLAHAGGLVTGAAGAWLLTRPPPRAAWPWGAALGALAAVAVAACWPRPGLTLWERTELEGRLHAALRERDVPAARALLARADAGGADSERLRTYRAYLLVQEDALEPALEVARPLLGARDPAVREEAARLVASVAKVLAYRHYTGDGAERNPWRALAYMDEACLAGDEESCRNAARVRGAAPR
jgi:membrane associated rhomboid family serine protease